MKRLIGLLVLTLSLLPIDAQAPIRVGFYEFGLMFDGEKGLDKDIVDAVAKRTGRTFTGSVMARARIWKDLETGDLEMSVSGIPTPERELFAWFVPYLVVKLNAIVSNRVAETVSSPAQFLANKALRWGVVTSFKHGPVEDLWISQMRLEGRIEDSTDVSVLFKKLAQGRIDGLFSQPPIYKKYLADLGMSSSVAVQDWAPKEKGTVGALIFSKKHFSDAEVDVFRKAIQSLREDGTLYSIFLRYLSPVEAQQALEY